MTTALATHADPAVLDALRVQPPGHVHSVFRTAVNIERADGTLWSLVTRRHPGGPATISLDTEDLGTEVAAGAHIRLAGTQLGVGGLTVNLATATPRLRRVIRGRPSVRSVAALRALIDSRGVPGGVIPSPTASGFAALVGDAVAIRLARLREAVARDDRTGAVRAAESLLGLGVGLTPAGDDALAGFAVACHHVALPLGTQAVAAAVATGATNAVSLTALRAALSGDAIDPVLDLVAAVLAPYDDRSTDTIETALTAVLSIGHTSGTDLACGVLAGVTITTDAR